jgi:DNA-binding response OmpR family regulator
MTLLLVEDDTSVQELVTAVLEKAGFSVDIAKDAATGHRLALAGKYEVIILDLGLPDMDGIALLNKLRSQGVTTHILILTSKDEPEDRIRGLDSGADDYVSKSCVLAELEARVRALIRRKYNVKNPLLKVEDLEINTATRSVSRAGKRIPLTPREYSLLEFLAIKTGQVVTRADIWESLYAMDPSTSSNVVDVYIGYLRKKVEGEGLKPLIHTRRGTGFVLGADAGE